VLTVAHRLNTIIDYDHKVVVLDDGQVVEHDNPRVLAERKNGTFANLLHSCSSIDPQVRGLVEETN
jgi:ABC-type multidrug transport system fused ATPase/permease subunit